VAYKPRRLPIWSVVLLAFVAWIIGGFVAGENPIVVVGVALVFSAFIYFGAKRQRGHLDRGDWDAANRQLLVGFAAPLVLGASALLVGSIVAVIIVLAPHL